MSGQELLKTLRIKLRELSMEIEAEEMAEDEKDGFRNTDGRLVCASSFVGLSLSCDAESPGAEDMLTLSMALASALKGTKESPETVQQAYRRIADGEVSHSEYEQILRQYGIRDGTPRCAIVIREQGSGSKQISGILEELAPLETGDVLFPWKRGQTVIVISVGRSSPEDELFQYAQALQETILGETGRGTRIGIGTCVPSLSALSQTVNEAERALDLGEAFHPDREVLEYKRLVRERLICELPKKTCDEYVSLLFHKGTARLFDEELLTTLDMFFEKDLNISDAARQLYIHRNTLLYRLDKVQRLTGLDLRKFEDAVTFKLLMDMKRCAEHDKGGKLNHA